MKRWIPQPLISVMLLLIWLALNNTVHPAHLVLGACLAIGIPMWTSTLKFGNPKPRQILTVIVLGCVVLYDIIRANIEVAMLILGPERNIKPMFVWVPLELTDPHAKAALAGIITMTPGTLLSDFSDDGKYLLVHAFNVSDPAALVAEIKARYEFPLKEIFE